MCRAPSILGSKFLLVAILLVLVSAAAVYAGTTIDNGSEGRADTVRPDGSLTSEPQPLSLEEVAKQRNGSPAEAVMRLWYWAQWGASPEVVAAYYPAVVRRLGVAAIAGSYAGQRASLLAARPRTVDVPRERDGNAVVTLEALRMNSPPERHSYTLKRVGDEWFVIFDTLLESGIAAYVQLSHSPDPDAKRVPNAAKRAGLAAARAYRVAFLCRGIHTREIPSGTPPIEASSEC